LVEEVFASRSADEVLLRLEEAGIANARLRDLAGLAAHPQLEARDRWRQVGSPAGELRQLLPPAMPDGAEPRLAPIPRVGEHTDAILAELGLTGTDPTGPVGHEPELQP
jgi:crotonobetainyl-CoA:carnitine CoA-transferase CaiB-like acyl-CoA transferase